MGFLDYQKNVYSQCGEDGILEELCRRLGVSDGWFCEFGAWDGKHCSNCLRFAEKGWRGVFIEGDPQKYQDLAANMKQFEGRVVPLCNYVAVSGGQTRENILSATQIPADFTVLSIDIDSFDWQVWESVCSYRPLVVVIEANSFVVPGVFQVHTPPHCLGSSFTATLDLGMKKGYTLVCHTGNMIFVRSDRVSMLGMSRQEIDFPHTLFNWEKHHEETANRDRCREKERTISRRLRKGFRALTGRK
jgi:hypothetical protein